MEARPSKLIIISCWTIRNIETTVFKFYEFKMQYENKYHKGKIQFIMQ